MKISIYKDDKDRMVRFVTKGHAEYADSGSDIVCAAVSILVINFVNSVERFTKDKFVYESDEKSDEVRFFLEDEPSGDTVLLSESMIMGIQAIEEAYGSKYVKLVVKHENKK